METLEVKPKLYLMVAISPTEPVDDVYPYYVTGKVPDDFPATKVPLLVLQMFWHLLDEVIKCNQEED